MEHSLELERISKAFGKTGVLSDIDLAVEPGEFLSLVGPSGCGKSTLLRIISGLERQDSGQVRIAGRPVDVLSPRARNIAMVFQNYALYPHMSAAENIALPLMVDRLSLLERLPLIRHLSPRRKRIEAAISGEIGKVAEALQIEPLLARKPGQLSGGQRQRVALARAMVRQPSLFLMDEPLSNLDAQLRVHMRDELTDLHRRLGATFIYVTHDQIEAMTMSTRIAMLDGGRLAQIGSPADLYERPASLTVARFIGSPAINILPARLDPQGHVMLGALPTGLVASEGLAGPVSLGLRPEHIRLHAACERAMPMATLRRSEHHGADRLLHLDLTENRQTGLIVRVPQDETGQFQPGETYGIGFAPEKAHLFGPSGLRMATRTLPARIGAAA
ncbi:MAG: ABC transporter ATP-binding protein [Beijerinckiaceae bacterium]|nr:ABC transporter ATP-binding protein [Beijerinckiaceae bacterium]MCZ8300239.1 ABC transporter ATP-binding protein [Beijerinckiaceae bacterium]